MMELVAAADRANAVATRTHELQARVRGALDGGIEVDPEATQDDVETMQAAVAATEQMPIGLQQREVELGELEKRIDDLRAADLALGGGLAKRRAALERAKAAAPAAELAAIDEKIEAIDKFGTILQGAITSGIDLSELSEKAVVKGSLEAAGEEEDPYRKTSAPKAPEFGSEEATSGVGSVLGEVAKLAWADQRLALASQVEGIEAGADAADVAGDELSLMGLWANVDLKALAIDVQVQKVGACASDQRKSLGNVGRQSDREARATGKLGADAEEAGGAAERLSVVLDAWQLQGAALTAISGARRDLDAFAEAIGGAQATEGWSSTLGAIVERTAAAGTAVHRKSRRLSGIHDRIAEQQANLDAAAKGTRELGS